LIRVILADHQAIYRAGMVRVLSIEDEFRVAAQCGDWERLLSAVHAFPKALIVVSSTFKAELETLVKRTREVGSRVLVIIEDIASFHAYQFMGAAGVVYRSTTTASFLDSVRAVARGDQFVPPGLSTPEADQVGTRARDQLTAKELKTLALLVEGMTNRQIADCLNTSEQVVKNKLRKIFDKTGV
jgi:DNA-binding NarL/FixJ family response regulator